MGWTTDEDGNSTFQYTADDFYEPGSMTSAELDALNTTLAGGANDPTNPNDTFTGNSAVITDPTGAKAVYNPITGQYETPKYDTTGHLITPNSPGDQQSVLNQIGSYFKNNPDAIKYGLTGAALLQGMMQKSQDPVAQSKQLWDQAQSQAHTPMDIKRANGTTEKFDRYGSISVAPMARTQVAYTGNPTGAGLPDINGNPTQGFQTAHAAEGGYVPTTTDPSMQPKKLSWYADGGYVPLATGGDVAKIQSLYTGLLGHPTQDTEGVNYWADKLSAGQSLADIAREMGASANDVAQAQLAGTFQGNAAQQANATAYTPRYEDIADEYKQDFGITSPDAAGMDYWAGELASGALNPNTIGNAINTAGMGANVGTVDTANPAALDQIIANLYSQKGRTPDKAGMDYWTNPDIQGNKSIEKLMSDWQTSYDQNLAAEQARAHPGGDGGTSTTSVHPDVTPITPPPSTPPPIPAGGSSTVNTLPTVAPLNEQRNTIPFSGDFLHYGQGPEHLFYNKVNPLYGGPGSVWDPTVPNFNAPTVSNENVSYTPPTVGPTRSQINPTNAFSTDIAHGQTAPGAYAWWNYNNQANQVNPQTGQPLAKGGQPIGGLGALQSPRMQGHIKGADSGQADTIPAALSSGEFVIPADVVGHLGDGNTDAGAQKLYGLMHKVRKHKGMPAEKLPPVAKDIGGYLK